MKKLLFLGLSLCAVNVALANEKAEEKVAASLEEAAVQTCCVTFAMDVVDFMHAGDNPVDQHDAYWRAWNSCVRGGGDANPNCHPPIG